ncbi:MAG: redoxin domain-containing protein [Actinomycetota bacterium]
MTPSPPTSRSRTSRLAAALGGLALVIAACSSDSGDDAATATDAAPAEAPVADATDEAASPAPTGAAPEALRFDASLIGGGDIDLAADFDGKPTLLWFWAPWCSVCNREAPTVESAAQEYGDQIDFVGVAWSGSDDQFAGFVDDHALTFPQISDDPGLIYERFGVAFQPAMVVIQPDGELQRLSGSLDDNAIASVLAAA